MVAHEVGRARGRAAAANGVRWWFGLARAGELGIWNARGGVRKFHQAYADGLAVGVWFLLFFYFLKEIKYYGFRDLGI